jgi:ubiquitin-like 1-activating enzyme E1 B
MLFEDPEGEEPSTYMETVTKVRELLNNSTSSENDLLDASKQLLKDLYCTEIQKQLDMGRYKAAKKTPKCLEISILDDGMDSTKTPSPTSTTDIWSLKESIAALASCLVQSSKTSKDELLEEFDKDDDLAMRFVTASSNLRSSIFSIEPLQSLYSAKGIAGNIIPAIATTNAICAGLQVLQAFSILKKQIELKKKKDDGTDLTVGDCCYYVNCIRNRTRNGLYLIACPLEEPNPNCFVCKNAIIPLSLNVEEWTLKDFLQRVIKARLGFQEPTLLLNGDVIWEEGEGAEEEDYKCNLPKTLKGLPCGGIQHGTVLEIDDNSQNLCIQVLVSHQDVWEGDEVPDFPFTVGKVPPKKEEDQKPAASAAEVSTTSSSDGKSAAAAAEDDDDDDIILIVGDDEDGATIGDKKRSMETGDERPSKKAKTADDEVIEIDDD